MESILFTPAKIGSIEIPNRFVRSATHDYMAEKDGSVSSRQVDLYGKLAEGEIGLIITGHAYVHPHGIASPYQTAVSDDSFLAGLKRITDAVHRFPSRIFLQASHAGRQTIPKLCSTTPPAPSAVYEPVYKIWPKEMDEQEIHEVIEAFIQAGRRAKSAGFDGIQLHAAHGYLLSSFLSPYTNRRKDRWGGSTANRLRIVVEILRGIKDSAGIEFPVIVKLNSTDFIQEGLNLEESMAIARILEKERIDGFEVSGGMTEAGKGSVWKGVRREEDEGYFVENAARIKSAVSLPVFGLGGIRTFQVAEKFIKEGRVDLISMSRPFIREPLLVKKFHQGEVSKSECISCNKCFNLRGIRCAALQEA